VRCGAGHREEPSLTAQHQNTAADGRRGAYSRLYTRPWEGIKPEPGMCVVCMDTVRFEEHSTEGELPHHIH